MKIDSTDLQDKEFSFGPLKLVTIKLYTVCPGISDPFYIAAYYMKWVTTSWTDGNYIDHNETGRKDI